MASNGLSMGPMDLPNPTDLTDLLEAKEATDPTDLTDLLEAMEATDPTDLTDLTNPMEATDLMDPLAEGLLDLTDLPMAPPMTPCTQALLWPSSLQ